MACSPVLPAGRAREVRNGCGVFAAFKTKYRVYGASRMQQLHDTLTSVGASPANTLDPAREIQELRRICIELETFGNIVVEEKKVHARLKSLSDKHYGRLQTIVQCDKPSASSTGLVFEKITRRATSFHAMELRGKLQGQDNSSHGQALNTFLYGGARGFRKQDGRTR